MMHNLPHAITESEALLASVTVHVLMAVTIKISAKSTLILQWSVPLHIS